jgi:hypothetical protein
MYKIYNFIYNLHNRVKKWPENVIAKMDALKKRAKESGIKSKITLHNA